MNKADQFLISNISKLENSSIVLNKIEENLGTQFHDKKEKGANLRELSNLNHHQVKWETPFYENILKSYLNDLSRDSVIADLGCGDGRFIMFLLEMGFKNIVAIDAHLVPLLDLESHLKSNGLLDKVTIINSSLDNLPLVSSTIDAVLAINSIYYLGKNQDLARKEIIRSLKSGGTCIVTEHSFEAVLLRSLIFNDFDSFIKTFETKSFKETSAETQYWFPVTEEEDVVTAWENLGAKYICRKGISIFHQFVNLARYKNKIPEDSLVGHQSKLGRLFQYFEGKDNFNKTNIFNFKKI